jgi:hypothetical protein
MVKNISTNCLFKFASYLDKEELGLARQFLALVRSEGLPELVSEVGPVVPVQDPLVTVAQHHHCNTVIR